MIDDWLDNFGHTMIIGATNSGKTTLAKYLLNRRRWRYVWVCSPHKEHKYFQPKRGCRRTMFSATKEEFKERAEQILDTSNDKYEKDHKSVLWFDDFNQISDMSRDSSATQLYNRGRHRGFRIIHVCHNITAIGPGLRANVRYMLISDRIQHGELKELMRTYNIAEPEEIYEWCRNYSIHPGFVFVDRETGRREKIEASTFEDKSNQSDSEEEEQEEQPVAPRQVQGQSLTHDVQITPPANSTMGQGEVPGLQSIQPVMNALHRQQHAGRDFFDQSHNTVNINQQINTSQRVLDQRVTHQMQINEQSHQVALMHHVAKTQLKQLAAKPFLTREDEYRIVECLRSLDVRWQVSPSVKNYQKAMQQVWPMIYDGHHYTPPREEKIYKLKDFAHFAQTLNNINGENLSQSVVSIAPFIKKMIPALPF